MLGTLRAFFVCLALCVAAFGVRAQPTDRDTLATLIVPPMSLGELIGDNGVYELLNSGGAHAGYVFETEPLPATSPLWGVPNVLMSPHCSSVYDGWERASFEIFLRNLERWIAGEPLVNVVDPTRGY